MKTRSTLLLLGVFAAILAYWLLFERHAKSPEEAARDAKKLFAAEGQEVRSLTIERPGAPAIHLERAAAGRWRLTAPLQTRAERWSADAAAGALLDVTQTRAIPNDRGDKGLEEMGLKPPRARVTFTLGPSAKDDRKGADEATPPASAPSAAGSEAEKSATGGAQAAAHESGAAQVLEIGEAVPTTDMVFARVPGRSDISLVPSGAIAPLLRTADELRDRALLDTTALDVFDARIERKGGESLHFHRREGEWWMEQPIVDAAEGAAVQALLTSLIGLRADPFEDAADAAGLEAPDATIRLLDQKGGSIAEIALGATVPGQVEKRHVRVVSQGEPSVVALAASQDLAAIAKPASEFRSRKALSFRSWDANGLNLTSPGVTLSFARKDGAWTAVSPSNLKLAPEAVDETLQMLSDLAVVSFDAPSGRSPKDLGLSPPRTKVEIKMGEPANHVLTLVFGAPADGPNVLYATVPGRPVFTVPSSILERINRGASLYERKAAAPTLSGPTPASPGATGTTAGASGIGGSGR